MDFNAESEDWVNWWLFENENKKGIKIWREDENEWRYSVNSEIINITSSWMIGIWTFIKFDRKVKTSFRNGSKNKEKSSIQ